MNYVSVSRTQRFIQCTQASALQLIRDYGSVVDYLKTRGYTSADQLFPQTALSLKINAEVNRGRHG